jgi:hypothetical protein
MPLRPVGSVLTIQVSYPGGIGPQAGLSVRRRSPAAHLINWPGSSLPVGYRESGWSLPMKKGAIAATGRYVASIGTAVAKGFTRAVAAGVVTATATLHTARLRWRLASGTGEATGTATSKGLSRATCTGRIGASPSALEIAYAVLGAPNAVTGGWSLGRAIRGIAAVNLGKKSGDTFRNVDDTADQVTATTTPAGDRTSVTVGA